MAVKIIERRQSPRYACIGELPAAMTRKSDGTAITCVSVDASRMGLGFLCSVELDLEELLVLGITDHPIT
ncbi:hypothetical protein, partial [Staphylococcus aureus]